MIYLKEGNVPLNLSFDDDIIQEANSTYQLSFKFPVIDNKWELLKKETFLLADDLHGEQEFIIIETKKKHGYIQIYANQVATLLNYYSIDTISVSRVAGQTVMSSLAGSIKRTNHPFSFFSDIMDRHTFNQSDVSVMEALTKDKHSIVGQWGGDLVRDKYQIKLLKNGGSENESLFMYKKNLSGYEESGNIKSLRTRIHFKKVIKATSEGEEDKVFAVTVDSPLINQYNQIYEGNVEVNDQDVTDQVSLTEYGRQYFARTLCDVVEDSITLDVKGQSDTPVKMFDVVSVYHERFNVDMRLKISKYSFMPMAKRLKSIGFGKVNQSFGGAINNAINSAVSNLNDKILDNIELKLQAEIENANRHFDAEFDKRTEAIYDGIERAKADAEVYADTIRQGISQEFDTFEQEYQVNKTAHERQVSDIRAQATDAKTLAQQAQQIGTQAKVDAANALTKALQYKSEAIAEAQRLDIAERQVTETKLATAKSQAVSETNRLIEVAKSLLAGQIDGVSTELTQTKENIKLLATKQSVESLTGRISSAESSLQVQAGEIASRVKTSDFDQAKQRLSTAESSITQLGNRITTEISETKSLIPQKAGGRNYIRNSQFAKTINGRLTDWEVKGIDIDANRNHFINNIGSDGIHIYNKDIAKASTVKWQGLTQKIALSGRLADVFTLSFEIARENNILIGGVRFGIHWIKKGAIVGQSWENVESKNLQERILQKKSFKFVAPADFDSLVFMIYGMENVYNNFYLTKLSLVSGSLEQDWSLAWEDLTNEIETVRTTITQTAQGQEQLSTRLSQAEGRVTTAETNIRQHASEIAKKLSRTEVESLIDNKGFATSQTVQNLVTETAGSFERQITETKALIPTSISHRNLAVGSSDKWNDYVNITSSNNWNINLTTIHYGDSTGIYAGTTINIIVYLSADNIVLDSSVNPQIFIQGAIIDKNNATTWTNWGKYSPISNKWKSHLVAGNNYRVVKFSTKVTADSYNNIKGFNLDIRIDGVKSGKFHWRALMITTGDVAPDYWTQPIEDTVTQTAFNTVKDTVDAHKRLIGDGSSISQAIQSASKFERSITSGGDIYQAIETAKGLVSRVSSLSDGQNLVYDPTNYSKYKPKFASSKLALTGTSEYKLLRITQTGLTSDGWQGFQMPLHSQKFTAGEKLSYRVNIWVDVLPDDVVGFEIKNGTDTIADFPIRLTQTGASQIFTGTVTVSKTTTTTDDYGLHVWLRKNGTVAIGQISIVRGDVPPTGFVDSTSAMQLAAETQMSQLAGSWAVKNLTSAGTVLNQINLLANGTNRIDGRLTHITGQTLIDNAVIKSAMIDKLKTANFESGSVTAAILAANSVTADKLVVDQALFNKLMANEAYLKQLFAKNAFITQVQAVTLSADQIAGGILRATNNATYFNLNTGDLTFNTSSNIVFNQPGNALKRVRNGSTGFLHFNDSSGGGVFVGLGVTSGNIGVKSQDTGSFSGVRVFRDSNSSDQLELYGDNILMGHAFASNAHGLWVKPTKLSGTVDLIDFLRWCRTEILRLHDVKTTEKDYNYTTWGVF